MTGGGTTEKIDDVRYISNYSSGKMASSLASTLYCRGADVTLIATRFEDNIPKSMQIIDVENSNEMLEHLTNSINLVKKEKAYLFMAAAVSDYIPADSKDGKLKKDALGESWNLALKQNIDILNSIDKDGLVTVGFKAEMDESNALSNATNMLNNKNLNAVCLNVLKDSSSFGSDTNSIEFISKNEKISIPNNDKLTLAFEILNNSKTLEV